MGYSLKNPPEGYARPAPPKLLYWLVVLAVILAASVVLTRIFSLYIDNQQLWLIFFWVPAICWSIAITCRLAIWMLQDMKANSFDKAREAWIFSETCRARRALQILDISFITGHSADHQSNVACAMLNNENIIFAQSGWNGNEGARMSRIDINPEDNPVSLLAGLINGLIESLNSKLYSEKMSLVVAFDISSTISRDDVLQIWEKYWSESEITLPVEYITGSGLKIVDSWLNNHVEDNAMLLIVALQVAPVNPDNTAEVAVSLLLGNRLTQQSILPMAQLHRPDSSSAGDLDSGMRMAAYNVPVKEDTIKHLWLSGLSEQQHAEVIIHQDKHLAQDAIEGAGTINLDSSMGQAGAAAPWLAIAAAAEIAQQTQSLQMIISGDITKDVMWSAIVAPMASRKENDA